MNKIVCFLCGLLLLSCLPPERFDRENLMAYLQKGENGLSLSEKKDNTLVQATYRPQDLVFYEDLLMKPEHERDSLRDLYKSIQYFIIRFSRNGMALTKYFSNDLRKYGNAVDYLSGGVAKDMVLIHGSDTLFTEDIAFMSAYDNETSDVLAAFRLKKDAPLAHNLKLIIEDYVLGTGRSEFEFTLSDIKDIPELDLNSSQ